MQNPLVCPIVAPGGWPGATDEDREKMRQVIKSNIAVQTGMESCVVKGALSGVGGFAIGAFFSLMSSSFRYEDPFGAPNMQGMNNRQKAVEMFRDMGRGMWRSGRGWGAIGLLFSGSECIVEGYRGQHDVWNVVAGGFLAGAINSYRGGVKSGLLAGAGFAVFGAAVDKFYIEREPPDDP